MLALITLATWEVVAALALVTLLVALWLRARHWSVKRLVVVSVYYNDGTRKDFITFPWRLKKLFVALAENPRIPVCYDYSGIAIDWKVKQITLSRFDSGFPSDYSIGNPDLFEYEKTLWDSRHALLANVLKDFGVEDDQPLPPRMLCIAANQRLDELRMKSVSNDPSAAHVLTDTEVAYLKRLDDCLRLTIEKKWARSNRLNRFNGKLPGTEELVMELLATDEGAKRVIACINRDWKPELPIPPVLPRHGGHC